MVADSTTMDVSCGCTKPTSSSTLDAKATAALSDTPYQPDTVDNIGRGTRFLDVAIAEEELATVPMQVLI